MAIARIVDERTRKGADAMDVLRRDCPAELRHAMNRQKWTIEDAMLQFCTVGRCTGGKETQFLSTRWRPVMFADGSSG